MFISLTHAEGRALVNIEQIVGIVEYKGNVLVSTRVGDPVTVFETYDDIVRRIEDSRGKVW